MALFENALLVMMSVERPDAGPTDRTVGKATFAGGCFWCMEYPFDRIDGVIRTTSGYIGGELKHPSYEEVATGETGHAEAVEVVFDPRRVSYEKLLHTFWRNIDPLTRNRQFCDVGPQYRTAIFYHDEMQKSAAEASREAVAKRLDQSVATEIVAATTFYPAESYHQKYYRKNPIRYQLYSSACGRKGRLEELWGDEDNGH